jgi:predicted nuclease with RNAse H fold
MSGNSAYITADVNFSARSMTIVEAIKEPRHSDHKSCHRFLEQMITRSHVDAIAIDAPLSFPRPLIDPTFPIKLREGNGEITNPYLFRYTDYYIWHHYGLKPMPPAGDRIGRLSARAIVLLQQHDYRFPTIGVNGRRIPVYEVYPRQIARAMGHDDYKKSPSGLLAQFTLNERPEDPHLIDALLCCYAGAGIIEGHTQLPDEHDPMEGWCFPLDL